MTDGRSAWWRLPTWALLYVAAGYLGRATIIDDQALSLVWPAAGVAVLWVISKSRRTAPFDLTALATCVLAVNLTTGAPLALGLVFVFTNLVQTIMFVLVTRHFLPHLVGFGGEHSLTRLSDLGNLARASALTCLFAALIGTIGLWLTLGSGTWLGMLLWWSRNCVGLLAVVTLGLLLRPVWSRDKHPDRPSATPRHSRWPLMWETSMLVIFTGAVYVVVFPLVGVAPTTFLLLVPSVWAGIRMAPMAVIVHGIAGGALAIAFTLNGFGPFMSVAPVEMRALLAQLFVLISVVTGLALALTRVERDTALDLVKETVRASAERASLLAAVLTNMHEGVVVVDEDDKVIIRNPAGSRLMGLLEGPSSDAVLPAEAYGLFHLDGSHVSDENLMHRRALAGEEVVGEDYVLRTPTIAGGRRLEMSAARLADSGSEGPARVVITFLDVTTDREHRDNLASFAGVVAHDLSNPLTVIAGWGEALADAFGQGQVEPADGLDMVRRIQTASAHMRQFIGDLLGYAIARNHPLRVEDVDLSGLAEGVAQLRCEGDSRPRIAVQPGMSAHADLALVRQLLDNLVGNAVKYVAPGVRPMITIFAWENDSMVEVTVDDNGIGIPSDERARVFENFHRAHVDDYSGTGIGLAICARVVERHGGQITISDNPCGKGNTVRVHAAGCPRENVAGGSPHRCRATRAGTGHGPCRGPGAQSLALLEARGLAVDAPDFAQRVADLPQRRLGAAGIQHRRDHVAILLGGLEHLRYGGVDRGLVSPGSTLGEESNLLGLHFVGDPQNLELGGHGVVVAVHPDDFLLALLQRHLVDERSLRDLRHEPAVLDPP